MRKVRSASGTALAIALAFFGCGESSTPPKDASVERWGTGSADSGARDTSGADSVASSLDSGAGERVIVESGIRDGATDLSIPMQGGPDGALDLAATDVPTAADSPSDTSARGQDALAGPDVPATADSPSDISARGQDALAGPDVPAAKPDSPPETPVGGRDSGADAANLADVAAVGCIAGYHDGGDGTCVASGTCSAGFHNDGTGFCVQTGCASGYHDGGNGTCVANGTGGSDGGDTGTGTGGQGGSATGPDSGAMDAAVADLAAPDVPATPDSPPDTPAGEGDSGVDAVDSGASGGCADSRPLIPGQFHPVMKCQLILSPGDPYPDTVEVLSTPMVVDFNFDNNSATVHPSIVIVAISASAGCGSTADGLIRVIDGASCTEQFHIDDQRVVGASSLAIGDIDLDGRPEIVAHQAGGGLVAFRYDGTKFVVLWRSTLKDGTRDTTGSAEVRWNGPSIIADLDGDGYPEVMTGAYLYDHNGRFLANNLGEKRVASAGGIPVVADVDGDGKAELVTGDGVYTYNASTQNWDPEAYFTATRTDGFVALGDFGSYPITGVAQPAPEVVVVVNGEARIQTLDGTIIFGPYTIPSASSSSANQGGPPSVADFDGDGKPEFALAGLGTFNVFDMDCVGSPVPSGCYANGILWSMPLQDFSSSVTGSSAFDFDGDGIAEAIYGDECFTRIYRGTDGEILLSQARNSGTYYEYPVVADVDGDFRAELVSGSSMNCVSSCPAADPYFKGLRCQATSDCPSGSTCQTGFCRCQTTADCGGSGSGFDCMTPLAGTPGSGNVCRTNHPAGVQGLQVFGDLAGNWTGARTIWNQHAYFVTNVNENGTIPATGAIPDNWEVPSLNNFRMNVQGAVDPNSVCPSP